MSEEVDNKEEVKKAVKAEKDRLLTKLLRKSSGSVLDYKNTIKHTGGLLTQSMVYAYSKGLNDAAKIITKEEKEKTDVEEIAR